MEYNDSLDGYLHLFTKYDDDDDQELPKMKKKITNNNKPVLQSKIKDEKNIDSKIDCSEFCSLFLRDK